MPDLWAVFGIAGLSIAYSANRAAPYNSGMVVRRPPHQNIAKQADRPDRASVVLCRRLSFGALLAVLLMLPSPYAQSQTIDKPHDTTAPTDAAAAGAFKSCIAEIAPDALRRVSQKTFDAATSGLEADPQILHQLQSQPEFNQPIWQYLDAIVNEDRIAAGRVVLLGLRPLFNAVEEAFGADRFIIAAIWGVESNFGTDAFVSRHPCHRDARLHGAAASLFSKRISCCARNSGARRRRTRSFQGFVVRGFWRHAIHADNVLAVRGGF